MDEFEVIRRYFSTGFPARGDVEIAVGDDGAVTHLPADRCLVTVTDALVAGTHFPAAMAADEIAHRALAANLSDLAAMAALPHWFTLALAMPEAESGWLTAFARGLRQLAQRHDVALIGGDTVRGPLAVTITALGTVPPGAALTRNGARVGDEIFLTGTAGEAGWAWQEIAAGRMPAADDPLYRRFAWPEPRLDAGRGLQGIATACIDVSDGLHVDLGRLLAASGWGGEAQLDDVPVSAALVEHVGAERARQLALTGGEDYELCFTAPPGEAGRLLDLASDWGCRVTRIGRVRPEPGLCWYQGGQPVPAPTASFQHF